MRHFHGAAEKVRVYFDAHFDDPGVLDLAPEDMARSSGLALC